MVDQNHFQFKKKKKTLKQIKVSKPCQFATLSKTTNISATLSRFSMYYLYYIKNKTKQNSAT